MSTVIESQAPDVDEGSNIGTKTGSQNNGSSNDFTAVNKPKSKKTVVKGASSEDNSDNATASDDAVKDPVDTAKTTPATPKKRAAGKTDDSASPAKKKRASPKSKKLKEEVVDEDDGNSAPAEAVTQAGKGRGKGTKSKGQKENTPTAPLTPPKTPKGKKSKTAKGGKSASSDEEDELAAAETTTTTKKGSVRKRAAAGKIGGTIPISTSLETASAADKMLVRMKDEGKSWAEIRSAWTTMTGEETKHSTLPNRYTRLKANFMNLKEGDGARLLAAEAAVRAEIDASIAKLQGEKWAKMQKAMEDEGTTEKYPTLFLQKKYEEFVANPDLVAALTARADAKESNSDDNAATGSENELKEGAAITAVKEEVDEEIGDHKEEDDSDTKMEEAGENDGEGAQAAAEET